MKRSQMLLRIQEILIEQPEDMTLEQAADDILTRLEKSGILPPLAKHKHKRGPGGAVFKPSWRNEWEEE